jgi:hypothetical protein
VNRDIPAGARAWGCPAVIKVRPENSGRITELSDHEPD